MKEAKVVALMCRAGANKSTEEVFLEHTPPGFNVTCINTDESSEDKIAGQARDADFLVIMPRVAVPERVVRAAKQLKLIQLFTQGYERIPVHTALELGIPLANVGGANAVAVAEHTALLMLAVMRCICPSVVGLKEGKLAADFDRRLYHELCKKLVGIVGFGNVGRRVAKIVQGFEANVIFYDQVEIHRSVYSELNARPAGLEELLRTADIVSLHVPLLESTRGLIGWEELNMMKASAILVNTSRGQVIDEESLIRALREKKIAGAGLDVFVKEPPSPDNPLLSMENVVATPHIAGYTWENLAPRIDEIWENIVSVWQGKPPHNVITKS